MMIKPHANPLLHMQSYTNWLFKHSFCNWIRLHYIILYHLGKVLGLVYPVAVMISIRWTPFPTALLFALMLPKPKSEISTPALFSIHLALNMRGASQLGLTWSISLLLIPWRRKEPGHQQPWYWLCRIGRSLSYSKRNFNYLCLINVDEWHKM